MAGIQGLGLVVRGLEKLIPLFGASTPEGQDVVKALTMLARHVPPGAVTPAAERNSLQQMALQNQQRAAMMQKLQAAQAQGAAGQQPGAAAAAA